MGAFLSASDVQVAPEPVDVQVAPGVFNARVLQHGEIEPFGVTPCDFACAPAHAQAADAQTCGRETSLALNTSTFCLVPDGVPALLYAAQFALRHKELVVPLVLDPYTLYGLLRAALQQRAAALDDATQRVFRLRCTVARPDAAPDTASWIHDPCDDRKPRPIHEVMFKYMSIAAARSRFDCITSSNMEAHIITGIALDVQLRARCCTDADTLGVPPRARAPLFTNMFQYPPNDSMRIRIKQTQTDWDALANTIDALREAATDCPSLHDFLDTALKTVRDIVKFAFGASAHPVEAAAFWNGALQFTDSPARAWSGWLMHFCNPNQSTTLDTVIARDNNVEPMRIYAGSWILRMDYKGVFPELQWLVM